jgi:hypothetical protein
MSVGSRETGKDAAKRQTRKQTGRQTPVKLRIFFVPRKNVTRFSNLFRIVKLTRLKKNLLLIVSP